MLHQGALTTPQGLTATPPYTTSPKVCFLTLNTPTLINPLSLPPSIVLLSLQRSTITILTIIDFTTQCSTFRPQNYPRPFWPPPHPHIPSKSTQNNNNLGITHTNLEWQGTIPQNLSQESTKCNSIHTQSLILDINHKVHHPESLVLHTQYNNFHTSNRDQLPHMYLQTYCHLSTSTKQLNHLQQTLLTSPVPHKYKKCSNK